MYRKGEMIKAGNELYVLKHTFKIETFQPVIDRFGPDEVRKNYHCDTILKSKDGYFLLTNKINDAEII